MTTLRRKIKKQECKHHRLIVYESALDRLIAGKTSPEYVQIRWGKYKAVK